MSNQTTNERLDRVMAAIFAPGPVVASAEDFTEGPEVWSEGQWDREFGVEADFAAARDLVR